METSHTPVRDFYEAEPYPFGTDYGGYFERFIAPELRNREIKCVLDAGCGTGDLTRMIALELPNAQIDAIDFSQSSIEAAKAATPASVNINYYVGDLTSLADNPNAYDFIYCQGVLHHIRDPEPVIRNFRRSLVPQGLLIAWLYNPFGRRDIEDVIELNRRLGGANQSLDAQLSTINILIEALGSTAPGRLITGAQDEATLLPNRRKMVDRYFNPYYRHYTLKQAQSLFESNGFQVTEVLEFKNKELPDGIRQVAHERGLSLHGRELTWSLLELLKKPRGLAYALTSSGRAS
ncbi:class I SAM-dependent methyltransferase [Ensifer sp. IC4062]|nr:class I SAM-dependent methyltransferase [Ensifer sp. IC4062]MCA1441938.1 class I SAM-dependent methyltransferase [Ensifer sp. IC4062]